MRLFVCQHHLRSSGSARVVQQLLECSRMLLSVPTLALEQNFHICHLIHSMCRPYWATAQYSSGGDLHQSRLQSALVEASYSALCACTGCRAEWRSHLLWRPAAQHAPCAEEHEGWQGRRWWHEWPAQQWAQHGWDSHGEQSWRTCRQPFMAQWNTCERVAPMLGAPHSRFCCERLACQQLYKA